MRTLLSSLSLAIVAVLVPHRGSAQGPPGGGAPVAPVAGIDLATARKLAAAAEAAAIGAGARVAIAIVDVNGDLVYFQRMDGAHPMAVTSSQGKARAAVLFGMPTKALQDAMAAGRPVSATLTAPPRGAVELTPMQGGVPILKDGKVVAAIGVGGAAPAQDEAFALAGINAISPGK